MSKNQLIALGAIAGVLLFVFAVKQLGRSTPDIETEYGLQALAPEGFLASDVSRIELYRGSEKNSDKVLLAREKGGWTVESAYGAPGKKDKVDEFLKKIKGLEGELRSEEASVLGDFDITDEKALHLVAFKEGEEEPWCHLLVGRKEAYGSSFIRRNGEDTVYTVNVNIASEVGLWGDDDKAPESSHWVDKTVVDLDKDKIERLALTTPDRSLALEKREKKSEDEEGEAKEEGEEEEKKEYEWVLAEGGPGAEYEFKKKGVDDILGELDSFEAGDVVDPAKKKDYGLDAPGFRLVVGIKGGRETVLVAAREKPGEDAYMMVEGKAVVYKVADWKFDDVFPDGNDLFEMKGVGEDKDKVRKITLVYPSVRMELVKEDDEWKITSPSTGLEFKEREAEDLAEDLAEWKPVDYADGEDLAAFGLAEPERKVSFVVAEEAELRKHTISLGAEAKGVEGRYALLDGAGRVWIVGKWDVDKIMPEPKDFFDMDVADIEEDDIAKVSVERDEDAFELVKEGDRWKLSAGGEEKDCDDAAVSKYLGQFKDLEAADVLLGRSDLVPDGSKPVVTVTRKDGSAIELIFGKKHEGKTALRKKGAPVVFLVGQDTASSLAPPAAGLIKAAKETEE